MASDPKFSDWYFSFSKERNRTPSQEEVWNAALASREEAPATPPAAIPAAPKEETNATIIYGRLTDDARRRTSRENIEDVLAALTQPTTAQQAEPAPASAAVLTEMQCREIYWDLDKFGRDLDTYDYGLPMLDFENRAEEVFALMRDAAARAIAPGATKAPEPDDSPLETGEGDARG